MADRAFANFLRSLFVCVQLFGCSFAFHDDDPFVGVSHGARYGPSHPSKSVSGAEVVVLDTPAGDIRISLFKKWSESSVQYVSDVASKKACGNDCKLYRAEPGFLLQGALRTTLPPNTELGPCPEEFKNKKRDQPCPSHDPNCGCHGPIMNPGMVGWAGGSAGPDFFIYVGNAPATHWNNDHTVWGELADKESYDVVNALLKYPTNRPAHGMAMLNKEIHFTIKQEEHKEAFARGNEM